MLLLHLRSLKTLPEATELGVLEELREVEAGSGHLGMGKVAKEKGADT